VTGLPPPSSPGSPLTAPVWSPLPRSGSQSPLLKGPPSRFPVSGLPSSPLPRPLPSRFPSPSPPSPLTLPYPSSPTSPTSPISPKGSHTATSPFAKFKQLESEATKTSQSVSVRCAPVPSVQRVSSLPPSPRPTVLPSTTHTVRSGSSAKDAILQWVQSRLESYPISVTNFSTCWNDGLAFCALIHVFYPDSFDWFALKPENRRYNFTLGFKKAEELADIYPLLDVDDMVKLQKPDWKSVFTYVQSFYQRFRDGRGPVQPMAGGPKPPLSDVAKACLEAQEAENKAKETVSRVLAPRLGQSTGSTFNNTSNQSNLEDSPNKEDETRG